MTRFAIQWISAQGKPLRWRFPECYQDVLEAIEAVKNLNDDAICIWKVKMK